MARFGQRLVAFAKCNTAQLEGVYEILELIRTGEQLTETLQQFSQLSSLIYTTIPKFSAAVEQFCQATPILTDNPAYTDSFRTKATNVSNLLHSLVPTTLSSLSREVLPDAEQHQLLSTLVANLKQYSLEVAALRELVARISGSDVGMSSMAHQVARLNAKVKRASDKAGPRNNFNTGDSKTALPPTRPGPHPQPLAYVDGRPQYAIQPHRRTSIFATPRKQPDFAASVAAFNAKQSPDSPQLANSPQPTSSVDNVAVTSISTTPNSSERGMLSRTTSSPSLSSSFVRFSSRSEIGVAPIVESSFELSSPRAGSHDPDSVIQPALNSQIAADALVAHRASITSSRPLSSPPTTRSLLEPTVTLHDQPSKVANLEPYFTPNGSLRETRDESSTSVAYTGSDMDIHDSNSDRSPSNDLRGSRPASTPTIQPLKEFSNATRPQSIQILPQSRTIENISSSSNAVLEVPDEFESGLEMIFDVTQCIASSFSVLGEALNRQDIEAARTCVDSINSNSTKLLQSLMIFSSTYVTDPLLISTFADLVRKFESCSSNFYRIFSTGFGSSGQLQISASTRAFSSGISGLLEFLVREKSRLNPISDQKIDPRVTAQDSDRRSHLTISSPTSSHLEEPKSSFQEELSGKATHVDFSSTLTAASPSTQFTPRRPSAGLTKQFINSGGNDKSMSGHSRASSRGIPALGLARSNTSTESLTQMMSRGTDSINSRTEMSKIAAETGLEIDISISTEEETDRTVVYEQGSTLVKLGTLNQLVIHLTHETKTDMEYMKTFLATYHSFTTPEILLSKLFGRYFEPSLSLQSQQIVRLRVINALRLWLKARFDDFSNFTLGQLWKFINVLRRDGQWTSASDALAKLIDTKMGDLIARNARESIISNSDYGESRFGSSPAEFFFTIDIPTFAQQLSVIEFSIWQKLKASELMNQAWMKPDLKHKAPHVVELVSRFNSVSHWVASVILWEEKLIERSKVVSRFIELAAVLESMNNFNSLLEILSGFNNAAVHRLKFTFAELSKRHQATLERLNKKMHSELNYKNYRDELRHCNPPVLPYMGVYLTDLIFVEEGIKSTVDGLINFQKRRQLYKVLREIEQYQTTSYDFPRLPHVQSFLAELPHNDADELYRLSLILEPRGIQTKKSLL